MSEIERLDKVLSNMGYGTRKEVKKLVKDGRVAIDGVVANDSGIHIDPGVQQLFVDGVKVNYRKYIYIMMNKPPGVISATEDTREKTVIDILPDEYGLFNPSPVGRLDKDTVGLLLLTNDGQLIHRLLAPKKHVPKVYFARVRGAVDEKDVEAFKNGVVLDDGYATMPANLKILEQGDESGIEVEIFEGKYHQVKRMFEAVGKKVVYLKRMSMGPIVLDESLRQGDSRELTQHELEILLDYLQ